MQSHISHTTYHIQTGFVLTFSVLVAGILLAIGIALYGITLKELVLSSTGRESQFAFYAADTGGECALYWDIKHPGYSSSVFAPVLTLASTTPAEVALVCEKEACDKDKEDIPLKDYMSDTLGHSITTFDDEADQWDTSPYDVVVISGSVNHDKIGWMKSEPVGILTLQGKTDDEFELGESGNDGDTPDEYVEIQDGGHYITSAYSTGQEVDIADEDKNLGSIEIWNENISPLAVYVSKPSETWLIAVDQGGTLYEGGTAAERRVFLGGREFNRLSLEGEEIFSRALLWAARKDGADSIDTSYTEPVPQNSNILCNAEDISDPETGWDPDNGWDITIVGTATTTVFDMAFDNGSCATVTVIKDLTATRIDSRGYNTCDITNPRRVERGLRITH